MIIENGRTFEVRSVDGPGMWFTDVSRYYSWATGQLANLISMHELIEAEDKMDLPDGVDVEQEQVSNTRWSGYLERNMLSDTIVVFSAMAAEAFLNFYGVVRLGEIQFVHLERLGIVPKVKKLALVCDSLRLSESDPVVSAISKLSDRRNALVHPKAVEASPDGTVPEKWKRPVLENAAEAVEELNAFLREFRKLVPNAAHLLPYQLRTEA